MASNRHRSRLHLMMKLPMASSSTRQFPAIIFNFLNHVSYFQRRTFLNVRKYRLVLRRYICGVGLGVAVADGTVPGVVLGATAGVELAPGVAGGIGVALGDGTSA